MSTETAMPMDVTPTIELNDMSLDTASLDIFSSLDDLVEEKVEPREKTVKDDVVDVPTAEHDEETTEEDEEFSFDDIEDEDQDENGHTIEKEESDDEDGEDEGDDEEVDEDEVDEVDEEIDEDAESEDEEVEYEGYMVTLPDGEEVNLAEAVKGYRTAKELDSQIEQFNELKTSFQEQSQGMMGHLKLAQLEADRVIEDYKDFDWAALAKEDPQAYVENKEFLERYSARKQEIVRAMETKRVEENAVKQEEFKVRAQSCVSTLKSDIPGWNDEVYQDLMTYAIENGTPEEDILNCVDPSVFKMLHKASQFDKGQRVVKAKVKRAIKSPKKVMKSAPKAAKAPGLSKAKLEKRISSGDTSGVDLFNSLED